MEASSLLKSSPAGDTNCQVHHQDTGRLALLKGIKSVSYRNSQKDALTMPSFLRDAFQNVFGKING